MLKDLPIRAGLSADCGVVKLRYVTLRYFTLR